MEPMTHEAAVTDTFLPGLIRPNTAVATKDATTKPAVMLASHSQQTKRLLATKTQSNCSIRHPGRRITGQPRRTSTVASKASSAAGHVTVDVTLAMGVTQVLSMAASGAWVWAFVQFVMVGDGHATMSFRRGGGRCLLMHHRDIMIVHTIVTMTARIVIILKLARTRQWMTQGHLRQRARS